MNSGEGAAPLAEEADRLLARLFAFLAECRAVRRRFAAPSAAAPLPSAQVERELYAALVESLEAGLVGLTDDVLEIIDHVGQARALCGQTWLRRQERALEDDQT